jgi:hypothetical protein
MQDQKPTPQSLHQRAIELWENTGSSDSESEGDAGASATIALEMPGDRSSLPKLALRWAMKLDRYEQFWRTHERAPREKTRARSTLSAVERRLGEWARYQRRFQDHLSVFQQIRLDISPAFSWEPVQAAWTRHLGACRAHYRATGRLPFLNGGDRAEKTLARWLNLQLRQLKNYTLLSERSAALTEFLRNPAGATPLSPDRAAASTTTPERVHLSRAAR